MINSSAIRMDAVWNTFQEPRCPAYFPNSYMLLLSALDLGWRINKTELVPSLDQYGFIYLVTLKRRTTRQTQQLILPRNELIENLLQEHGATSASFNSKTFVQG